ncbi:MAG: sodium/glutamate symporter [Planctomycetota bacterium]
MFKFDMIQTVAFAGMILFLGHFLCRKIPLLARYNLPAPIIGGLFVALLNLLVHAYGQSVFSSKEPVTLFQFDMTLKDPFMIAFFTTIGFSASLSLLKTGGRQVLLLLFISIFGAILQNMIGMGMALLLGIHPLFGVVAGSVALTGGPGTAATFGPEFEKIQIAGTFPLAGATIGGIATAMVGILAGGLIGAPLATALIRRNQLKIPDPIPMTLASTAESSEENMLSQKVLRNLVFLFIAMGVGTWLSLKLKQHLTLPPYIGAMFVAAILRNIDDSTYWIRLSPAILDIFADVALSLFLVIALMTLELWKIAGLALPLFFILVVQVVFIVIVCYWFIFRWFGKDYEAAVMSSGFCGFMLGTTANSMANMKALTDRYGPAPRAFLVIPIVGVGFLDFVNAILVTGCIHWWK